MTTTTSSPCESRHAHADSTAVYLGSDADIDARYHEFRDLTTQTDDLTSLAIATAGLIFSFAVNDNRVAEAAALASELEDMVSHIDCDAEPGASSSMRWHLYDSRIANSMPRLRSYRCDTRTIYRHTGRRLLPANALLGAIETCAGRYEQGRRRLREELEHARALPSARYAIF